MATTMQRRVRRTRYRGHELSSIAVLRRENGERSAYVVGRTAPEGASVYARMEVARAGRTWLLVDPAGSPVTLGSAADVLRFMAGWGTGALEIKMDEMERGER